jgi:hypothetical protein
VKNMAVTNFIPQIWEARLMAKFHERSVGGIITTAPTKIEGNKIIFNKVSDIALKDYEGTVNFDDLTTSKVELPMDVKKYWAFKVDDVDAVQAAGELIDPHVAEAGYGLQEATDKLILDEALKTSHTVEGEKAYDVIVKANSQLKEIRKSIAQVKTVINQKKSV